MDLNADLGEGFGRWTLGDDRALLNVVTSANIACGFHAGDPATLLSTCRTAVERGVAIGAHVGYRDLVGFGRRFIDISSEDLIADVIYQVGALQGLARAVGGTVAYIKPHGALYNTVVHHEGQAAALVEAIRACSDTIGPLPVLGLPGSTVLRLASEADLPVAVEAFADRAYTPAGTLVPRTQPGALLHDPAEIAARMVRLATCLEIVAIDGTVLPVQADSVCVHGDAPSAVAAAEAIRDALLAAKVPVRSFLD